MSDAATLFDTPPEPAYDRLTRLASALLGVPVALLSLVDDERQFFKSIVGLTGWAAEARGTPLSHSFCQHVVAGDGPLIVEDARVHPLVKDNPAITDLGVVAYLGVPVHTADGRAIGSLCAIDGQPHPWTERDRETLAALASAVDAEIALHQTLARQQAMIAELSATNAALQAARADADAARATAEQALADRTRLFAALGHELRTPLNGIFGGLALLGSTDDPDRRAGFVNMIRDSADTLMRFVDNVVGYAGASAGRLTPRVAPFDPTAPAEAAIRACAGYAASRKLTLRHDATPPLRPCASDAKLVEQILTNLVGNAVKYTRVGGVTVTTAQQADTTLWRVRDTGPGVPAALRDSIFEAFDRGDPATAAQGAGSGLGLAVARLTASALGGSVQLEPSAPGEGAEFVLRVPTGALTVGAADRAGTTPVLATPGHTSRCD